MWNKSNIVYFKVLYLQLSGRFTLDTNHIQICTVPATPPGSVWAFKYLKVVNFHYKYQKMILLCCVLGKWIMITEMQHATEVLEEKYITLKMYEK